MTRWPSRRPIRRQGNGGATTPDRFVTSLNERRFDDLVELLDADVIQDWPQSGETFRDIGEAAGLSAPRVHQIVREQQRSEPNER